MALQMSDIKQIFDEHHVHYVTSGPNTARGNINIKCPFCGHDDPSEHMGINLDTGQWGCWRDSRHRGGNLPYLLSKVLSCSREHAQTILGRGSESTTMTLNKIVKEGFNNIDKEKKRENRLRMPDEFLPITRNKFCLRFVNYLIGRGFRHNALDVSSKYGLKYALSGEWKNRIVIPLYYHKKLVSWTGRSILAKSLLRYKTLTIDRKIAEKIGTNPALKSTTSFVFNYDDLMSTGGLALFVCEGPFDAIKLDYYGEKYKFRATCLFTSSISKTQVADISSLFSNFEFIFIIGDKNAEFKAMKIKSDLSHLNSEVLFLPPYAEDPASLTPEEIEFFCTTGKFPIHEIEMGAK
jgi:hypothetical protein